MSGHLHPVDARDYGDAGGDQRIRVLLAERHPPMRRALKRLLEQDEDMEVVGEADDFASAVTQVRARRPQVLVLDVRMSGAHALDSIRELRAHRPHTELVLITMESSPTFASQALECGARGLVLKDVAEAELAEAVRQAARGLEYRSPRVKKT
jgi:DNA-binding NarL/FixJ family response regulator